MNDSNFQSQFLQKSGNNNCYKLFLRQNLEFSIFKSFKFPLIISITAGKFIYIYICIFNYNILVKI